LKFVIFSCRKKYWYIKKRPGSNNVANKTAARADKMKVTGFNSVTILSELFLNMWTGILNSKYRGTGFEGHCAPHFSESRV
jgi:hypothetical protein